MGSAIHPHVALIAFPFGTHAAPLFTLARALASAAPGTTFSFISSARSNAAVSRAFAGVDPLGNLRVYDVSDGCPEGHVLPADNPEEEVSLFLSETPGNLTEGVEAAVAGAGGLSVSCIVSDAFIWFAGKMAVDMGVPWVPLWTGGPCSLLAHVYTDLLRSTIGVGEEGCSKDKTTEWS